MADSPEALQTFRAIWAAAETVAGLGFRAEFVANWRHSYRDDHGRLGDQAVSLEPAAPEAGPAIILERAEFLPA